MLLLVKFKHRYSLTDHYTYYGSNIFKIQLTCYWDFLY